MAEVTGAQLEELAGRGDAFLKRHTPAPVASGMEPAQHLAEVALLLALPRPRTSYEAAEQVEALASGSLRGYAASHVVWAQDVMVRVQRHFPDPHHVPSLQPTGARWTPEAWRARARQLLGQG
jgi:hypothetical protein